RPQVLPRDRQEPGGSFAPFAAQGQVERGEAQLVFEAAVGAAGQQQAHLLFLGGSPHQRGGAAFGGGVHVGPFVEEELHAFFGGIERSVHQRGGVEIVA